MKCFNSDIKGRDLFPLWAAFLIVVATLHLTFRFTNVPFGPFPSLVMLHFVTAAFTIPFLRRIIPSLSFDGEKFSFSGTSSRYLRIHLKGSLLSLLTLGLYLPWYIHTVWSYLLESTSFRSIPFRFSGTPQRLLLRFAVFLLFPVFCAAALITAFTVSTSGTMLSPLILSFLTAVLLFPLLFFILVDWMINLNWNSSRIVLKTRTVRILAVLYGQLLFIFVTLGLYFAGAVITVYRYYTSHLVRQTAGTPDGEQTFTFSGEPARGFALIWGYTALSLVTLFFAFPWGLSRLSSWFLAHTARKTFSTEEHLAPPIE